MRPLDFRWRPSLDLRLCVFSKALLEVVSLKMQCVIMLVLNVKKKILINVNFLIQVRIFFFLLFHFYFFENGAKTLCSRPCGESV